MTESRLFGPVLGCERPVTVRLVAEFEDGGREELTWRYPQSVRMLQAEPSFRGFDIDFMITPPHVRELPGLAARDIGFRTDGPLTHRIWPPTPPGPREPAGPSTAQPEVRQLMPYGRSPLGLDQ